MADDIGFRLARPGDKQVSKLIVRALDDMAMKYIGSKNADDLIPIIRSFFVEKKGNLYSHENAIVCEDNSGIIGSITGYDGEKFEELRRPFLDYIRKNCGFDMQIESETSEGEFYIDTIGVVPHRQGLGVGSKLIEQIIHHASRSGHRRIGLLVDENNHKARKLCVRLGFEVADERMLLGHKYEHLVFATTG